MKTIITENLQNTQRYIPHTLETRLAAVKTYRNKNSISFICRRYKVSKASLMRWNKKYDGTKESLMDKSHKPHSQHPNAHTSEELAWIKNLIKRNPNISMIELYAKLKFNKNYNRHPCSLFRILRKLGFYKGAEKKAKPYIPKPYNTPKTLGEKWQLDVKYVPRQCYTGSHPDKFYQYTMIDEASRERFIYPLKNNLLIQQYNLLRWLFHSLDTNQKLYKLIMDLNLLTLRTLNEYILSMYCVTS